MKLHGSVCKVGSLTPADRDAMFAIMHRNYENKHRNLFDRDLDAKQWAIVVRRPGDGGIVGFSTQTVFSCRVRDEWVTALYSGDTVVDRSDWGDRALAYTWGHFALELIDRHATERSPMYWFLTSKGFRTYHYLPLFFSLYYPNADVETPPWERTIIDALGTCIGGSRYDVQRGIIRADHHSDFVRSEIAELGIRRSKNAHLRTFIERNPGYALGDELCCLAPLTRANFSPAAYRVMGLRLAREQVV